MAGRRFRAADFRLEDDELTLAVATYDEAGGRLKVEERTFMVRSDRPLADVLAFVTMRDKFRVYPELPEGATEADVEEYVAGFERLTGQACAMIEVLIGEQAPLAANEHVLLGPRELVQTLSFLAREDLVIEALQGGDGEPTPEEAAAAVEAAAKDAGLLGEGDEAPLASPKPSSRGSSRSEKGSDGGRNGGATPAARSSRSKRTRATSTKT